MNHFPTSKSYDMLRRDYKGVTFRHTPFALSDTDSPETILERIGKGEFDMTGRLWESISSNAKELIKLMLDVDPR